MSWCSNHYKGTGYWPRPRRQTILKQWVSIAIGLWLFLTPLYSLSATWRVELDGSGDFHDIQPAITAAAVGDTILIGPGRFDTFHPFTAPAWTEDVIVGVTKDNLTFIGSGKGVTRIGTAAPYFPVGKAPKCFCSIDGYDGVIQNLTIEYVRDGIYWWGGTLMVEHCEFIGAGSNFNGIFASVESMLVRECNFLLSGNPIGIGLYFPTNDVLVEGCSFSGYGMGLVAMSAQNIKVSSTEFFDLAGALQFAFGSTGTIEQCTFRENITSSIDASFNSGLTITNTSINGGEWGIIIESGSEVTISDTVVENTRTACILVHSEGRSSLYGCHLIPGSGLAVECMAFLGETIFQAMVNNYWGTVDADSVANMIWDGNDDASIHTIVEFLPISNVPLEKESTSWGDLKAMWR